MQKAGERRPFRSRFCPFLGGNTNTEGQEEKNVPNCKFETENAKEVLGRSWDGGELCQGVQRWRLHHATARELWPVRDAVQSGYARINKFNIYTDGSAEDSVTRAVVVLA